MRVQKTIKYCNVCGKENCEGKEFILSKRTQIGVKFRKQLICTSMLLPEEYKTEEQKGKFIYRSIAGHGCSFDYEVTPKT